MERPPSPDPGRMGRRTSVFNRMSESLKAKYHHVFMQFDTDANGYIDENELHSVMLKLGLDLDDGEAKKLIDSVDSDGSGVIYFDEFLSLLEVYQQEHKRQEFSLEVFRTVFNKSGSGLMTKEELRTGMLTLGIPVTDNELDEMIAIADRTGDGSLSFEDFSKMRRGFEARRSSREVMKLWDSVFEKAPAVAEKYKMVNKCAIPMREFRHASRVIGDLKPKRVPAGNPKALQPILDGCQQNEVLELEEGVYTEPIVISVEGVSLVGVSLGSASTTPEGAALDGSGSSTSQQPPHQTGSSGKVVIEVNSKHPAVTLRCRRCLLENLEIVNHGTGPAVQVDQGFPDLVHLDIRGQHGGLLIKNMSHPLVRGCSLSHCRAWGMLVRDSKVIVQDCLFTGNTDAGLVVERSSSPWVNNCTFLKGKGCGLVFMDTASGVVSQCEISENGCPGVLVTNGANPILWKNKLWDGSAPGIVVRDGGRGHFEENSLWGNEGSDIEVISQGNPLCRKNILKGGIGSAVLIDEGGQGSFEGNEVSNYRLAGFSIGKDAAPHVVDNEVTACEEAAGTCGVALKEDASGKVVDNMLIGWMLHPPRMSLSTGLAISVSGKHHTDISGNIVRVTESEARAEKMAHDMARGHAMLRRRSITLTGK